jgi:4-alpha-glucanotransferase
MGEIPDLVPLARWLAAGGVRVLQILPLNEMALTEQSPYSALSGMAIDPLYLAVPAIPDFAAAGGERGLESDVRDALARLRASARVDYTGARFVKRAALSAAFEAFHEVEWRRDTARAEDCRAFVAREAWWLADYALFRALHDREAHRPWTEWPAALRQRNPHALDAARHELAREVLFYQYLQWTADGQWRQARAEARAAGVALFGDLPFLVDGHSADVWARAEEFDLDVSVGVPPDAFSAEGQDWGMPMPRWEVMAEGDYQWLRARARRHADLFSGYRVDHLVGLYRTFGRPRDKKREAFFSPATEPEQRAQGEHLLALLEDTGAEIIAEDLGTVPDFVRASLARLRIPGYRVLRWEREWQADGQPFRDPAEYPACSVATTGTHDTEPLAEWWTAAPREERIAASRIPSLQRVAGGADLADQPWDARVRDAFLETLYGSGADLTLLPLGDIFGWPDRINEPATVNDVNWRFMLPWRVDTLDAQPDARERQAALREWALRWHR